MSMMVFGENGMALTVGVRKCEERDGAMMPFFALAPEIKIQKALGDEPYDQEITSPESVTNVTDAFIEHGILMYFDNIYAADRFISMMMRTFRTALEETDWRAREPEKVVIQ